MARSAFIGAFRGPREELGGGEELGGPPLKILLSITNPPGYKILFIIPHKCNDCVRWWRGSGSGWVGSAPRTPTLAVFLPEGGPSIDSLSVNDYRRLPGNSAHNFYRTGYEDPLVPRLGPSRKRSLL